MGTEIERKFLVDPELLPELSDGIEIIQGYISTDPTVRVRIIGDSGCITVKGRTAGISKPEFEYIVPVSDAEEMLRLFCKQVIRKTRHRIHSTLGHIWELDIFTDANEGLIVAELELGNTGEYYDKPDWATEEVSEDFRYANSNLLTNPYNTWDKETSDEC